MQSHKDGTVRETFVLLQYTNTCLLMWSRCGLQKGRPTPDDKKENETQRDSWENIRRTPCSLFVSIFLIIPPHPHPLILSWMKGDVEEKHDQL